jgi:hypothetical protein
MLIQVVGLVLAFFSSPKKQFWGSRSAGSGLPDPDPLVTGMDLKIKFLRPARREKIGFFLAS